MGTRSLTIFQDDGGEIVMYRQMDGYPNGHGAELKKILADSDIVNGFGVNPPRKQFNGIACLAASVVAALKDGVGSIYLYPSGTRDMGEEYIYFILNSDGRPWLKLTKTYRGGTVLYDGPILKLTKAYRGGTVLYDGPIDNFNPAKAEDAANGVT